MCNTDNTDVLNNILGNRKRLIETPVSTKVVFCANLPNEFQMYTSSLCNEPIFYRVGPAHTQ